jgi:hypothetical protein
MFPLRFGGGPKAAAGLVLGATALAKTTAGAALVSIAGPVVLPAAAAVAVGVVAYKVAQAATKK